MMWTNANLVAENHSLRVVLAGVAMMGLAAAGCDNESTVSANHATESSNHSPVPSDTSLPSAENSATPPPSPSTQVARTPLQCIATLPRSLKVNQMLMLGAVPDTLPAMTKLAAANHLGGIILMQQATGAQVRAFQAPQEIPAFVSTDEEGGLVMRYTYPDLGPLPAAAEVPGMSDAQLTAFKHQLHAYDQRMAADGINMNLAPLADVAPLHGTSFLGSRIISNDPAVVAKIDKLYLRRENHAHILGTLKHYFGLATTGSANTDLGPASTAPLNQLGRQEQPYRALVGTNAAIMTNNATSPGLSDGTINSLSRAVVRRIRRLGYHHNLIITDSLSAGAVTHLMDIPHAVVRAMQNGTDIALDVSPPTGHDFAYMIAQVDRLASVAITDGSWPRRRLNRSVQRIFARKHIDPCALPESSP